MKRIQSEAFNSCTLALLLALVVLGVFWGGVKGGFIFDDFPTIVENSRLHITHLEVDSLWQAAFSFQPGGVGRPLSMATLGLNYAYGGLDPYGYKLTGLLIHAINAVLVFLLAGKLLKLGRLLCANRVRWVALSISLIWALHPLQVSTVLYVVQRMETLSLMFVLMALLLYLQGRSKQMAGQSAEIYFILCVPLVTLGVLAKESAILFFMYCVAFEITLLRFSAQNKLVTKLWVWFYGIGTILALLVYFFIVVPHYGSEATHTGRTFNTLERLFTQMRVLPMYLKQILIPLPGSMTFNYDNYVVSRSLFEPITTLLGGLLLLALFLAALLLLRRNPVFSLGVLLFFFSHMLTSNVVALELVFEHRNYFALFGVILAILGIVSKLRVSSSSAAVYLGTGALIIGVAVLGWVRAATWGDPLHLAMFHTQVNPESARAAHAMGVTYYEMADGSTSSPFYGFALGEFEREAGLPNSTILAEQSLILLSLQAGNEDEDKWWGQLVHKLEINPITVESTAALFALADNHANGVNIDGERLLDAFIVMFNRIEMPVQSYISVAQYALKIVGNEAVAENLLLYGIERAVAYPDYVIAVLAGLEKDGYVELARRAEQFAVSVGVLTAKDVQELTRQRESL